MKILLPFILSLTMGLALAKPKRNDVKKEPWYPSRHDRLPEYHPPAPKKKDHTVTDFAKLKVDHFNANDDRTFMNRYFMNAKYYKPGGPAFLYFPGEDAASDWFIQTYGGTSLSNVMRNAKKLNGIAFILEHRYFGESVPVDNADTPEGVQYLTSRQALADAAEFIKYCNHRYNLTGAKWVALGGSYSGALSAFFREKYPELVIGAISNSGPLLATNDFKDYLGVVGYNLKKYSMDCFQQTWDAFAAVQELFKNNPHELQNQLELCKTPPANDKNELANLMDVLDNPFTTTMQYGGNNRGQYGNQSISGLCAIMTNRSVPLVHRLREIIQWSTPLAPDACVESGYREENELLRKVNKDRGWRYLCCNEFGWFMTTNSPDEPFADVTGALAQQHFYDQCYEVFGLTRAQIDANIRATNEHYGGNRNMNATNVVIINGSQDPCYPAGTWRKEWEKPGQTVIFQNGAAHCAESYAPRDDDMVPVKATRIIVDQKIAEWIRGRDVN